MSSSTVLEWLEENSYRAYPLQEGAANVFAIAGQSYDAYRILLDANLTYSMMPDAVTLDKIILNEGTVQFYVSGQSTFTLELAAQSVYYLRNDEGSLLVINGDVINSWPRNIKAYFVFSNMQFEPSVCYEVSSVYNGVSSLHFADGSSAQNWASGYQFSILANGQTLQLEAGVNRGLPLPCGDYIPNAQLLSCDAAITSINGAAPTTSGQSLKIVAGDHVRVYNDPQRNTVYIGLDFVADDIKSDKILSV